MQVRHAADGVNGNGMLSKFVNDIDIFDADYRDAETLKRLANTNLTFAHYTSAANFLNILGEKRMWMRNVRFMNDSQEVLIAANALNNFLNVIDINWDFTKACENLCRGSAPLILGYINGIKNHLIDHTHVISLSEHHHIRDRGGKLSMWRGYSGEGSGIAIVLNKEAVAYPDSFVQMRMARIEYATENDIFSQLKSLVDVVWKAKPEEMSETRFVSQMCYILTKMMVTTKNSGFNEESEWRLFYFPSLWPNDLLKAKRFIATPKGVPETIYGYPIGEKSADGVVQTLDFNEIIQKVIIGPCSEQNGAVCAIIGALESAGVKNAERKVRYCGISYRARL